MTHEGLTRGCDARSDPDARKRVLLKEGKRHWITDSGRRFDKQDGRGTGLWPASRLILESIKPIEPPAV